MIIILRRVILVVFILSLSIPWGRPKPAQAAAGFSPAIEAGSPGSILYPQGCSTTLAAYILAQVRQLAQHSPSSSLVLQPGQALKLVGGTGLLSTDAVMVYVHAPDGLRHQFCVYYSGLNHQQRSGDLRSGQDHPGHGDFEYAVRRPELLFDLSLMQGR